MKDVNGTRFHLLLGQEDWEGCTQLGGERLAWDGARGGLRLGASVPLLRAHPGDKEPPLDLRRGAGRDRHGNWYEIDAARQAVRVTSSGSGLTTDFWPLPGAPCDPPRDFAARGLGAKAPAMTFEGLAVTDDQHLVVGARDADAAPRTWLLVFDLKRRGPPRWLLWPSAEGVALSPFDLAPIPGGGLWILDRARRRLWRLNRFFRVALRGSPTPEEGVTAAGAFHPPGEGPESPEVVRLRTVSEGDAIPIAASLDPVAVEALDAERVVVVAHALGAGGEPAGTRVLGWRRDGTAWGPAAGVACDPGLGPLSPSGAPVLIAHDAALLAGADDAAPTALGRLYVAAQNGNQAFGFDLAEAGGGFVLTLRREHLPMRSYQGEGVVGAGGDVWYASSRRRVPLQAQRRAVFAEAGEVVAPALGSAFDGREPDCVWHRLLIDARVPPGTAVAVQSRAGRTVEELALLPWQDEPPLRRRGASELPWATAAGDPREGTWELLFQRARGRFLQLKLTVVGDRTTSPTLRALRAWYPRFSYAARYLPAVYREDAASASFVERLLANPEGTLTELEGRIATAQTLFGARTTPDEALPWLLGWLGAEGEVLPDEARRRLFLSRAMTLYRARGTAPGLRMALRLALDAAPDETLFAEAGRDGDGPRIVERFRAYRRRPGEREAVVRADVAAAIEQFYRVAGAYITALKEGGDYAGPVSFPLQPPEVEAARDKWERVARAQLGLVPTIAAAHGPRWRRFLRGRHRTLDALRRAHGDVAVGGALDFAEVPVPTELPATPGGLADWYDFEAVVLSRLERAHRFSVLLPLGADEDAWSGAARERLLLAERVVRLQKPAHTTFDVGFYGEAFRVGGARLGEDSRVERRSRALSPATLGKSYAGESGAGGACAACGAGGGGSTARRCACG